MGEILRPFFQVHGSGRHVIIIVDMVGFCEVEKMGKDYKVKEIDLSGVKFIPGKYYYIDSFSKKLTEFDIYEFRIKADRVFAVGYNNQGTTEIEYDISRKTIFLHKENAELYLLMCNKFNNIDHELISEAEFRDIHVRFVKEIKKLDKDDKKNVIDTKTQFDSIITELDMIQKESKYVGTSKVFQVERGRVYNADEFEASGLKNITKYDESSKEQSNKEKKAR